MQCLNKEQTVAEISEEELNHMVTKLGDLISVGGPGPAIEKPNHKYMINIYDGRGNTVFFNPNLFRKIPGDYKGNGFNNHFFNAEHFLFDSVKDKIVPVIIKYLGKIYVISPAAWKAMDGRSENYKPAEIPITEPFVYKDGKLKCQCDFSGCGHYSGGDCALTKNLEKCVFKNRYHYLCCPRRRQMIENGETVFFNGKWLLQGEKLTD